MLLDPRSEYGVGEGDRQGQRRVALWLDFQERRVSLRESIEPGESRDESGLRRCRCDL